MRKPGVLCSLAVLALVGCGEGEAVAPLEFEATFAIVGPTGQNFGTHMTGAEEVPPRDTRAQGQTTFQLNRAETELAFRVNVANIQNVTQAHIHCGPAGANGPIVVWLYPSEPPLELIPGRSSGVLNHGVATEANLFTVPVDHAVCTGGIQSWEDLVAKLRSGDAYVNVHTSQFPPGEIRGQIRPLGPRN